MAKRITIWCSRPTPGHISSKPITRKGTCTPVFIAVLFTTAKMWKLPECPLTDEGVMKLQYIYTMECYSAIKTKDMMPFTAPWMEVEIIILSQVRKGKRNTTWHHLYVETKIRHKWTYLQNRNRLKNTENRHVVEKGEGCSGSLGLADANWCVCVRACTHIYMAWINNKVLLLQGITSSDYKLEPFLWLAFHGFYYNHT